MKMKIRTIYKKRKTKLFGLRNKKYKNQFIHYIEMLNILFIFTKIIEDISFIIF